MMVNLCVIYCSKIYYWLFLMTCNMCINNCRFNHILYFLTDPTHICRIKKADPKGLPAIGGDLARSVPSCVPLRISVMTNDLPLLLIADEKHLFLLSM
ncbi:hypothetical protein L6452_43314 [Arctium lappa]|uniref:Uncharacterized protein n=1 Tax=Arctium lappa TaxID=4217 RepID=A0ACB8XLX0_ARCLA|nr:hypothetical protein L6452_43314 [Arctium lappa]